jgi:hypothetical protein
MNEQVVAIDSPSPSTANRRASSTRTRWLVECLYWCAVALVVFELPWRVPVPGPIVSDSYILGFSNTAAVLGLAALLGLRWVLLFYRARSLPLGDGIRNAVACICKHDEDSGKRWPVWASIFAATLWVALLQWWWQTCPSAYFSEGHYFLRRLDLMAMGLRPYADFDYGYGPLLLQIPFWIHRASCGILPLDTSYVLSLALAAVLGTMLIHIVITALPVGPAARAVMIVLTALCGVNITLGAQYTPLRFVFPLAALLWLVRGNTGTTGRDLGRLFAAALACCAGAIGISPETGLTFCIALFCWAGWAAFAHQRRFAVLALAPPLAALALLAWTGSGYLSLVLKFAGGGLTFPIFPTPYILALIASAVCVVPVLGVLAFKADPLLRPMCAALAVCFGMALPPALGRCDPGHVFWNGLVLFLFTAALFWSCSPRWLRWCAPVLGCMWVAVLAGCFTGYAAPQIAEEFARKRRLEAEAEALLAADALVRARLPATSQAWLDRWQKRALWHDDLLQLLACDRVATPLGVTEEMDRFLKASGRYVPEFHLDAWGSVVSPRDLPRKLRDLEAVRYVLIPKYTLTYLLEPDLSKSRRWPEKLLSDLFFFPVGELSIRNPPFTEEHEVLTVLQHDYEIRRRIRGYLLLERRPR